MSDFIVDPSDDKRAIHAPSGRMAGDLLVAPMPKKFGVTVELSEFVQVGFVDPTQFDFAVGKINGFEAS